MLIKARLTGHEFDLITLADLFRDGDPTVAADAEGYYLSFVAADDALVDASGLHEAASLLLYQVNGVGRTRSSSDFRPVRLSGRFHDESGRQHAVVLADTAEIRGRAFAAVVGAGGQQPPPPPAPGPGDVQLARADSDVAKVLEVLGKADPAPDWFDLYKVFEILQAKVPGLREKDWVPKAEFDTFGPSADRPEASGDLARHARTRGSPYKGRVLTLVEGRQMIGVLAAAWLDWLRSSEPPDRP